MKKMNQVKQALNTCSPLEKIVKINGALGTGVTALSKKLCSECKQRNQNSSCQGKFKDESTVSGTKKQADCKPCETFQTPRNQGQQHDSSTPGCMPFTDDVPVKPFIEEDPTTEVEKIHPSLKNESGCGCKIGTTIPPED